MILMLAYLLNLFDLYCTMLWVNRFGPGIEVNPVGRYLLEANLAIPVKILGIGAAMAILYVCVKRRRQYTWTLWLVLGVYTVLTVYHLCILEAVV